MPLKSIRAWLGIDSTQQQQEIAPLRETLEALDHFEPDRARYLAAFAYLLGRVAHADRHVSAEETGAMSTMIAGRETPGTGRCVYQFKASAIRAACATTIAVADAPQRRTEV